MFSMILEDLFEELDDAELVAVNGGTCTSISGGDNNQNKSSKTTTRKDGTIIVENSDGSRIFTYPDGHSVYYPSETQNTSSDSSNTSTTTTTTYSGGCTSTSTGTINVSNVTTPGGQTTPVTDKLAEVKYGWSWCLGEKSSNVNYVTDDYGHTIDREELTKSFTELSNFHHGIDLKADKGERINSMMNGIVTDVGVSQQLGNYVIIKFTDGSNASIKYAHCDSIIVTTGQSVVAGQKVATVGNTGITSGYHLHVAYDGNGDGNFNSGELVDNPAHILFPGSL